MITKTLAALTAALWSLASLAQSMPQSQNCISLLMLDHTDVIDDKTILFHMKDDTIFRNTLPLSCPSLDFEDAFLYRVALNQLCDTDVITVILNAGFGLMPGSSCGLGKFVRISEDQAKALIAEDAAD